MRVARLGCHLPGVSFHVPAPSLLGWADHAKPCLMTPFVLSMSLASHFLDLLFSPSSLRSGVGTQDLALAWKTRYTELHP